MLERDGYFVQPTIVRDIPDSARLVMEKQFGPVLPMMRYSDIDETVKQPTARTLVWVAWSGRRTSTARLRWRRGLMPVRFG